MKLTHGVVAHLLLLLAIHHGLVVVDIDVLLVLILDAHFTSRLCKHLLLLALIPRLIVVVLPLALPLEHIGLSLQPRHDFRLLLGRFLLEECLLPFGRHFGVSYLGHVVT